MSIKYVIFNAVLILIFLFDFDIGTFQGDFDKCEMFDYGVLPDPFTVDPDRYNITLFYEADAVSTVRRVKCSSWTFDKSFFSHTIKEQVSTRAINFFFYML